MVKAIAKGGSVEGLDQILDSSVPLTHIPAIRIIPPNSKWRLQAGDGQDDFVEIDDGRRELIVRWWSPSGLRGKTASKRRRTWRKRKRVCCVKYRNRGVCRHWNCDCYGVRSLVVSFTPKVFVGLENLNLYVPSLPRNWDYPLWIDSGSLELTSPIYSLIQTQILLYVGSSG